MRKTPFQRHREEEERKKKRAEEEAAKLYEDFVESFGEKEEDAAASKSFVRGGTIQPGSSTAAASAAAAAGAGGRKPGSKYIPSFMPPMMAAALTGKSEDRDPNQPADESVFPLPSSARGDRGKTRNIDKMLETMKRDQEARMERQKQRRERGSSFDAGPAIDDGMGSFDDGDPFTTNLYVGNLAPDVDEEVLKREFLRYGDIASIKVMWPRDEEQRRRARNCGFVAYMTREGAERAKEELNGALLHELDLRIGWGKAVVLPPIPMYTSSGVGGLAPMMAAARAVAQAPPPGQQLQPPWSGPEEDSDPHAGVGPDIKIRSPTDSRARFIIDSVATNVLVDGCAFEQAIMTKEAGNPEFMFLFDLQCPEHAYYRWRLYSLAQGDSLRSWRNEPFVMLEGGPRWVPPSMTALSDGRQQTAAQRGGEAKEKDKPLSELQRDRFEDLLRALTLERTKICDAMVFALDNADSAFEVVETLTDSLTLPETPMNTKVARLMLASDVLHNSTAHVHNASRYRSLLEASLPDIFESLQDTYRSLESRMNQEVLRRNVLRVLRIWRSWFIFSDDFLNGLQATFLKGKAGDAGNPALRAELEALDPDTLAIRCRRNGLSRAGDRDAQIQRLINLQAYLSGDVKPEPLALRAASLQEQLPIGLTDSSQAVFGVNAHAGEAPPEPKVEVKEEAKPAVGPVSKWTLVDYDDEAAAARFPEAKEEDPEDIFPDLEKTPVVESGQAPSPGHSPEPDALAIPPPLAAAEKPPESRAGGERMDAAEEGRRARLRQIEVDVLLFREGLEDEGLPKSKVDAQVEAHRAKLLAEIEAKSAAGGQPSTSQRDASTKSKWGSSKDASHREKGSKEAKTSKDSCKQDRSTSPSDNRKDSDKHKDKTKAKDREKEKVKEKDKERDRKERKEKESRQRSSRSPSRSRDHRRSRSPSRSRERTRDSRREHRRSMSRSRSVSRERERDRHRRRSSSRDRRRSSSRDRRRDSRSPDRRRESRSLERRKDRETERKGKRRRDSGSRDRHSTSRSPGRSRAAEKSRRHRSKSRERDSREAKKPSRKESKETKERSRSPKKARHSKDGKRK